MSTLIKSFPDWMTGGIFTMLASAYGDRLPWAQQYANVLDMEYFGNHSGDKETSPLVDKFALINADQADPVVLKQSQIRTLADIIYMRYGTQWGKLYAVLSAEYNPIQNYDMTEEETPNITHTETPNISRDRTTTAQSDYTVTTDSDTTTDVYGFNSTSPVPQGEGNGNSTVTTKGDADKNITTNTETETGTRTTTETGSRKLTRSGNIGVTTSQQMLESEIQLWEWSFFATVFKNVDTVLTAPKYNF